MPALRHGSIVSSRESPIELTRRPPEVARSPAVEEAALLTPKPKCPGVARYALTRVWRCAGGGPENDLESAGRSRSPPPVPLPVFWEGPHHHLDEPLGGQAKANR